MEMMDIRATIQWLNESSDSMVAASKMLESLPKDETDFLRRELVAAQRALIETALHVSTIGAIRISDQVTLELPLLVGHSEDYLALVKAQAQYRSESGQAYSVLRATGPVNETAPAAPRARPGTPEDHQQSIDKRLEELLAKSAPPAVESAATPKADENANGMSSDAQAAASPIIVGANADQATKLSG